MKKMITLLMFAALGFFALSSCEDLGTNANGLGNGKDGSLDEVPGGEAIQANYELTAGQNYYAGQVVITADAFNFYVSITTNEDFDIKEYHIDIARNLDDIPQKKSNPTPGKFSFKDGIFNPMINEVTVTIPFDYFEIPPQCDETFYVAVHAAVSNDETAWAGDQEFAGKNWAKYFTFSYNCPSTPGGGGGEGNEDEEYAD